MSEENLENQEVKEDESDYLQLFKSIIEKHKVKGKKVALFTHSFPDPDAVSSMMGLQFLLKKKYKLESDLFFNGSLSHPQQKAIKTLLDPGLIDVEEKGVYESDHYCLKVLLDTCVDNAGVGPLDVEFDLVIDHHPPNGSTLCPMINLRAGSCAGTVYHLIKELKVSFDEDEDYDCRVATAIMVGVFNDTDGFVADDTTNYEHEAFAETFPFRVPSAWKQIVKFKMPKSWIVKKAAAAQNASFDDGGEGLAIYGMGFLSEDATDLLAITADEMLLMSSVEVAITFAVIDGNRIEGCIRTINPSVSIPEVCHSLGIAKGGGGWGKTWKGRYCYPLGGFSIDPDEDEDINNRTWELIQDRETRRVFRHMQK